MVIISVKILSDRLKERRTNLGLTQGELSKKAYLSKNIISNIERGVTTSVSDRESLYLSYALVCTLDYLGGLSNDPDKFSDGVIEPFKIMPDLDFANEIQEMIRLKPDSKEIEILLRDFIFFIKEELNSPNDFKSNKNIQIIKDTIEILALNNLENDKSLIGPLKIELLIKMISFLNTDTSDYKINFLSDFLDFIIDKTD